MKIRAVELDEVREMAARVVKEGEMRLAVIGPFADETVFQKYVK